ncbi:hypothetical protein K461DRAFT_264535 [Myriangium duriaei CBS 260.36]|uniref:Zn(2)-C6 fungal-type domain-containing protein n=1 Tax=Myriangium duriaei CBS 260.36 TaxID=1168546 RepID=A0A9P4MPW3_9PEZI|nr:hypothetical protein K461DRAFT_264535 [Myriangium duriaei CBS 260.36]
MNGALLPPPLVTPISSSASSSPSSSSAARRSTRACDACRRRKVRCNGAAPRCQQCAHLDITCMYSTAGASRRSRKTAAPRGTVIAACRNGALASPFASNQLPPPPPRSQPSPPTPLTMGSAHSPSAVTHISDHSSPSTGSWSPELTMRTPTFVSRNLPNIYFMELLPDYVKTVYPVNPVISEHEVRDCIARMPMGDPETLAFLYSYAALTVNLSHIDRPDTKDQVSSLLASALEHKRPLSHLERAPSALRIVTCVFIEICYLSLRRIDLAMIYLREAIGMLIMLKVHVPDVMAKIDRVERIRLERLYWECFIHERFSAVAYDKDVILDELPHLPEHDHMLSYQIHYGWIYTIQTFKVIDKDFVRYWLTRDTPPHEWVRQRHRILEDSQWKIEINVLPTMQQADIIVTRQWLRTILWQIAIRHMILSSGRVGSSVDETPSLTLPLQLSKELKLFLESFSHEEVSVHGTGIVFKLFEITNAIVDVILQLPDAPGQDTRERLEDLLVLKRLILGFPKLEKMHRKILEQKFDKIRGLEMRDGSEEGIEELVNLL